MLKRLLQYIKTEDVVHTDGEYTGKCIENGELAGEIVLCVVERYKLPEMMQCMVRCCNVLRCKIVSTYRRLHIKTPDFTTKSGVFSNFLAKNEGA